ncbi:MAG: hypothetical protein R3E12_12335 [Candidatus Eisenbacteria bacterium]
MEDGEAHRRRRAGPRGRRWARYSEALEGSVPATAGPGAELLQALERAGTFLADPTVASPAPPPRRNRHASAAIRSKPVSAAVEPVSSITDETRSWIVPSRSRCWVSDRRVPTVIPWPACSGSESPARCNHPNIATVYGLDETAEGQRFLVLEMEIEGRISPRGSPAALPVRYAVALGAKWPTRWRRHIVAASSTATSKPQNVRIDPDGVAKALDFGIAGALSTGEGNAAPMPRPRR